jgi:hypothetical protein
VIDRIGAEKWHDDRFERKFEHDTDGNADNNVDKPISGADVSDLAPWRARELNPKQHQHCAERRNELARKNDENCEYSERAESAQVRGESVVAMGVGHREL